MGWRDHRRAVVRPRHGDGRHLAFTLPRLGGDLKALSTFPVMAFTAMMTMRGVTGLARVQLIDPLSFDATGVASQRLPDLLGRAGTPGRVLPFAIAVDRHSRMRARQISTLGSICCDQLKGRAWARASAASRLLDPAAPVTSARCRSRVVTGARAAYDFHAAAAARGAAGARFDQRRHQQRASSVAIAIFIAHSCLPYVERANLKRA